MAVTMERLYLFVSPEEYAEVKALGASWDDALKSWYIGKGGESVAYARWLGGERDEGYGIRAESAFVASAHCECSQCGEDAEVICVYGERGVDAELGQALEKFTVSNIVAMDAALAEQLAVWPGFCWDAGEGCVANHCLACGAVIEDYRLHAEPGAVFFGLDRGAGRLGLWSWRGRLG